MNTRQELSGKTVVSGRPIQLWWLPALVFLVFLVAVNLCYLISAVNGQVSWCFPYLEGCVSISRAARQTPAIYVFRSTMIPLSAVLIAVWWMAGRWLRDIGDDSERARAAVRWLGAIGAAFLVLYTAFLGTEGTGYELMRRYGVVVFFSFTALAQIVLTSRLVRLRKLSRSAVTPGIEKSMFGFGVGMLALGVANIPVSNVLDLDELENVIEWLFALLMAGFFGLIALAWRQTTFGRNTPAG